MKKPFTASIVFLLCLLILSVCPSHAQVIHENPGDLVQATPYNADQKLMASLDDLFQSMDVLLTSLDNDDFNASRESLGRFQTSYRSYIDIVKKYNQSDDDVLQILEAINATAGEMQTLANSSEAYSRNYSDFDAAVSAGDHDQATRTAAALQPDYTAINSSARAITDNSTVMRNKLPDLGVDTTRLDSFLNQLNGYTSRMARDNYLPSTYVGNTSLSPGGNPDEPRSPDRLFLHIRLRPDTIKFGEPVEVGGSLATLSGFSEPSQPVDIYLDNRLVGNTTTREDGSFAHKLILSTAMPTGLVNLTARSIQRPEGAPSYVTSDTVPVEIVQVKTLISLDQPVGPYRGGSSAVFNGTLYSDTGRPVENATIGIYTNGSLLGSGTTDENGNYSALLAIPYDLTEGSHGLYAGYQPGEGLALAGSQSPEYAVYFEPGTPVIAIRIAPVFAFPGDELRVEGISTVDDLPLNDRSMSLGLSGNEIASTVTYSDGTFAFARIVDFNPGIYQLTVRSMADGLLAVLEQPAGIVIVMPFDLRTMLFLAVLVLGGLVLVAKIAGVDRKIFGRKPGKEVPVPEPQTSPLPEMTKPETGLETVISFEDEVADIDRFIAEGGDARETLSRIYTVLRKLAGSHGISVQKSDTHRDLFTKISTHDPSLNIPLDTFSYYYENAVFGHYQANGQDILNALFCLREIIGTLAGGEGQ